MHVEEPEAELIVESPTPEVINVLNQSCTNCACKALEARVEFLEKRFLKFEIAAPVSLRALDYDTVVELVKLDPYVELEVLEQWGSAGIKFSPGKMVRLDRYPNILDFVRSGLKLAMPQVQMDLIERYRGFMAEEAAKAGEERINRAKSEMEAAIAKAQELSKAE